MSLNVIVVAVIALIVLAVLAIMFASKTKLFGKVAVSCESKGGRCMAACPPGYISHLATDCGARFVEHAAGVEGDKCCAQFEDG